MRLLFMNGRHFKILFIIFKMFAGFVRCSALIMSDIKFNSLDLRKRVDFVIVFKRNEIVHFKF